MQGNLPGIPDKENDNFNLREQLDRYFVQWRWFVISIVICVFLAFLYLRYATPEYSITATILIKDEKKGGGANELSTFSELGLLTGSISNVDNEIEVLKARTLALNTINALDFNIRYFSKGNLKTSEIYKKSPVKVNFFDRDTTFFFTKTLFLGLRLYQRPNISCLTARIIKLGNISMDRL